MNRSDIKHKGGGKERNSNSLIGKTNPKLKKEEKNMKRIVSLSLSLALVLGLSLASFGHFQMIYPSDDFISEGESNTIEIKLIFTHPGGAAHAGTAEHVAAGDPTSMDMEKPRAFGVLHKGRNTNLLDTLEPFKFEHGAVSVDAWNTTYKCRGMGDFVFYLEPAPYFEPLEDGYITQYTKIIINAGELPTDWDTVLGMKAEIVPLSRTYPLWVGNTFQGIVMMDGQPAPDVEIEVEYLNVAAFKGAFVGEKIVEMPGGMFPGQVIKTDGNGVFTYSFPWSGWWGFAALMEGDDIGGKGQEVGACIMFKVYEAGGAP